MNMNFISMRSIFSWAVRTQVPWKQLRPTHLARFSSDVGDQKVKEEIVEDFEEPEMSSVDEKEGRGRGEKSINEVKLLGRIGKDPIVYDGERKSYVTFPLATSTRNIDSETGQYHQVTEWHTLVSYQPSKIEKIEKFLKRGDRVFVSGKLIYKNTGMNSGKQSVILINDFISLYN